MCVPQCRREWKNECDNVCVFFLVSVPARRCSMRRTREREEEERQNVSYQFFRCILMFVCVCVVVWWGISISVGVCE